MPLAQEQLDAVTVIRIEVDHVDGTNSEMLRPKLMDAVKERRHVVLDVSNVAYVDCIGLETLLSAVRACPGRLLFGGVRRDLAELLELEQLDRVLTPHPTVEAALEEARAGG